MKNFIYIIFFGYMINTYIIIIFIKTISHKTFDKFQAWIA